MIISILILTAGLVLLTLGAKWLVEGSSALAIGFGIRPIIVGMTVIAFGTSMPEFVFNLAATLKGSNDLGLGNIVGSNIANIGLVLGISALIQPIKIDKKLIKVEYPFVFGTSVLFFLLALDGEIGLYDGIVLSLIFVLFLWYMFKNSAVVEGDLLADIPKEVDKSKTPKHIGLSILGLVLLISGARLMVESAVDIARALEIPELIIGLTIIAIGTSLPELAASVVSTIKQEGDISLGNVLGSNIFNILFVIGILSLFMPTLAEGSTTLTLHFPAMLIMTALLYPLLLFKTHISRMDGFLFLVLYVAYMVLCYTIG